MGVAQNKQPVSNSSYSLSNGQSRQMKSTPSQIRIQPAIKGISDETFTRFLAIQTEIEKYERQGIFEGLRAAEEEFEIIEKNKRQAEINQKVLEEQTKKEKQDFENISSPTVQSYFKNKQDHDKAISKEQEEYLHSLNQLEIATTELNTVTQQYNHSKDKLESFKRDNKKAIELFNEQMNILFSAFEGEYGSDLENQLENDVRILTEQKDQLRTALNKWSNAKFLLVYAYNQLDCSEKRWSELMSLDIRNPEKVILATEVRNNLVASNQNLMNTKSYLKNVNLPYCTDEDLRSLQSLAAGIYQDMLSVDRQRYCLNIMQVLRKRIAALNQWFEQVIKETLVVDYNKIKETYDKQSKELKRERVRLFTEKIKEKTGKDVNINLYENMKSEKTTMMNANNTSFGIGNNNTAQTDIAEKPINKNELPPPPNRDLLLGNIEEIRQQYRQQVQNWNSHLDEGRREADERLKKMLEMYN